MAFRKFKVDCFHPNALQQIKDVVSGVEPKTTGLAGKYPDVNGFSSTAINQIKSITSDKYGIDPDIKTQDVRAFSLCIYPDPTMDPDDLSTWKFYYLGSTKIVESSSPRFAWVDISIDEEHASTLIGAGIGYDYVMSYIVTGFTLNCPEEILNKYSKYDVCTIDFLQEIEPYTIKQMAHLGNNAVVNNIMSDGSRHEESIIFLNSDNTQGTQFEGALGACVIVPLTLPYIHALGLAALGQTTTTIEFQTAIMMNGIAVVLLHRFPMFSL